MQVMDFIPLEHAEKLDYQQIGYAVDSYCNDQVSRVQQLKNNICPLTADEETIAKKEKDYGITPVSTATLNERRYTVWLRETLKVPYTDQWLRHWLKGTLSVDFELTMSPSTRTFVLYIGIEDEKNLESINALLDEVVPTDIGYIVSFLYNTYEQIKDGGYTYGNLNTKTFDQIRKMVI